MNPPLQRRGRRPTWLLVLALANCISTRAALLPEEVDANGTQVFHGRTSRVFQATLAALKSEGYQVAVANAEKGTIKTEKHLVGTAVAGNQYYAHAEGRFEQYTFRISKVAPGQIRVRAEPRIWEGDVDVSDQEMWNLDYQRTLWRQLFRDISDNLDD